MPVTRLFEDALKAGISPRSELPVNSPVLSDGWGFRPSMGGPLPYVQPQSLPFTVTGLSVSWPFPQVYWGQRWVIVFAQQAVYVKSAATAHQGGAASALPAYDSRTLTPATIPAGGPWEVADWGDFWMAFNGACMVYRKPGESRVLVETTCYSKAGCSFRGRPLFGNFVGYSAEWATFWATFMTDVPVEVNVSPVLGANSVVWGSILGGDALDWFDPDHATAGYYEGNDGTNPLWIERMKQNQLGFQHMNWAQDIVCIKPLDSAVLVYGSQNVSALIPVAGPFPTFGLREVSRVGVAVGTTYSGRGAVSGDDAEHVWVGSDGCLYRVDNSLAVTRLDYANMFSGIETVISSNPVEREYWISRVDGTAAWILTSGGLVRAKHASPGLVTWNGKWTGYSSAVSVPSGATCRIETWPNDFGNRELKNVTGLRLSGVHHSSVAVTLRARKHSGAAWTDYSLGHPKTDGFIAAHATGVEFAVRVESDYPFGSLFSVGAVDVSWNVGGKARYA